MVFVKTSKNWKQVNEVSWYLLEIVLEIYIPNASKDPSKFELVNTKYKLLVFIDLKKITFGIKKIVRQIQIWITYLNYLNLVIHILK